MSEPKYGTFRYAWKHHRHVIWENIAGGVCVLFLVSVVFFGIGGCIYSIVDNNRNLSAGEVYKKELTEEIDKFLLEETLRDDPNMREVQFLNTLRSDVEVINKLELGRAKRAQENN